MRTHPLGKGIVRRTLFVVLPAAAAVVTFVGLRRSGPALPPASAGSAAVVRPRFLFIQDTSGSMVQTPTQVPLSQTTDYPLTDRVAMSCSANPTTSTSCIVTANACTKQSQCPAGQNCSPTLKLCQTCCDAKGIATNGGIGVGMDEVCNIPTGMTTGTCYFADGIPTHGDGSAEEPGCDENGDGLDNDSKIYEAKQALTNIVAGYPEVEFALEHYHTLDNKSMSTTCGKNNCTTYADCPTVAIPGGTVPVWSCNNPTGGACTGVCQNCNTNIVSDNPADSTWVFDSVGECGSGFSCTGTTVPAPNGGGIDVAIYQGLCLDWAVNKSCAGNPTMIGSGTITCAFGNSSALPPPPGPIPPNPGYCMNYIGPLQLQCGQNGASCSSASQCCSGVCSGFKCSGSAPTCPYPSGTGAPSYGGDGDVLVPFSSTSDTATLIYPWINNTESDGEELRATGNTPIAGSLVTAKNYLFSASGPLVSDPSIPCRSYSAIVLTDGAETCALDPVNDPPNAAAALRNLVIPRGSTYDTACAPPPVCPAGTACFQGACWTITTDASGHENLSAATSTTCTNPCSNANMACTNEAGLGNVCQAIVDVKTYVLGFSLCPGGGDTCPDGQSLDNIALKGGTSNAIEVSNALQVEQAVSTIVAGSIKPELCNGIDDNCNGLVDEGYNVYNTDGVPASGFRACNNGQKGDCVASGMMQCVPASVDPTQTTTYCTAPTCASLCTYPPGVCALISPGATCPTTENCMNGDADCDGVISASCPPSCTNPQPEICNGLDDNCNGIIDECSNTTDPNCVLYGPGGGATCGSSVGVCKPGVSECCTPSREGPVSTSTTGAITAGSGVTVGVANGDGIMPGEKLTVDTGAAAETITVLTISGANPPGTGPTSFTANFTKSHPAGVPIAGSSPCTSATFGMPVCVGGVGPTVAVESNNKGLYCNGLDDDCNGLVDDGITKPCYPAGTAGCTLNSDGVTYTCLGICQAGISTCSSGTFGACQGAVTPQAEICDGLDDNCDGIVDDGALPGTGLACSATGVCGGMTACVGGSIQCVSAGGPAVGSPCYPSGTAGCTYDSTTKTYSCVGVCQTGTWQCSGNSLVCVGAKTPQAEICDGLDDNCDGVVDDGSLPGTGLPCNSASSCTGMTACVSGAIQCVGTAGTVTGGQCYPAGVSGCTFDSTTGKYTCQGICKAGTMQCASGALSCVGAVTPQAEICNGMDDDCDGVIPPNPPCPVSTDICYMGTCVAPCQGELGCPSGYVCMAVSGSPYCVPSKCKGVTCPAGQTCSASTGMCVDPCAGVTCSAGKKCEGGVCKDCSQDPTLCASGQICVSGACQADPCGSGCPSGQTCVEPIGCVKSCAGVSCPSGQVCLNGSCQNDLCAGVSCPTGQSCNPSNGMCQADACASNECPPPSTCIQGTCVNDPCNSYPCAAHYRCVTSTVTGEAECRPCTAADGPACTPYVAPTQVLANGGGGCACSVGGPRDGGSPLGGLPGALLESLLGLVALAALRRSRGSRRKPALARKEGGR